ncbi:MAG: serine/threonine protein kinase [Treponema sp.]|nr:serine/threonine protein kinase [Treponema sp.]
MEDEKTVATGADKTVASTVRKVRPAASPVRTTPSVAKIRSLSEGQDKTVTVSGTSATISPEPRNAPVLRRDGIKPVARRTDSVEKIGKYKIKKPLNEGGMGAVYLAVDPDLGENVVIKRLKASKKDSSAVERFKQEAKVLRELQSPRIANTFEFISEGRFFYFVQEYVEGCSVADLLEKQGTLSFPVAMKVFYEACSALKTVHSKKIVHRDIKPGNLLVSKSSMIKLTDFGIASNHSGSEKSESGAPPSASAKKVENIDGELTVSGSMLGTPSYMSPEQFYDAKTVGPQADIYSLGVMLYEMLTGKKPFVSPLNPDGSIDENKMNVIKRGDYDTPRKYNPKVPFRVCMMIHKMLKYDPEKRYQSVVPLIKIAEKYLSKYEIHDVNISIATIVANIGKNGSAPLKLQEIPEKEHKVRKVALIVVAALLAVGGVIYAWKEGKIQRSLLRFIYTPVTVTLQVPAAEVEMRYSTGLPMKAFFFHEEGKQDEVKGMRREFKVAVNESGKKVFTINPAVLTKGDYRVKIVFGSYVMWRSFRVGGAAVDIDENLQKEFRTVSISARSFDLYTGKDITAKTTFSVNYKGKWVPLADVPVKDLKAGTVWRVRGTATDYKTVEYSMAIDWYQDDIRVTMGMDPE